VQHADGQATAPQTKCYTDQAADRLDCDLAQRLNLRLSSSDVTADHLKTLRVQIFETLYWIAAAAIVLVAAFVWLV
jgi:hypothetical protein